jgi:hypothetical protein
LGIFVMTTAIEAFFKNKILSSHTKIHQLLLSFGVTRTNLDGVEL